MKTKARRIPRRRFGLERLESRVVLDADSVLPGESFGSTEELDQYLVDLAVQRYDHLFGTEVPQPTYWNYIPVSHGDITHLRYSYSALDSAYDEALTLSAGNVSFDGTNVQIAGIDEADVVKTDGEFIYVATGRRLTIIDAREPRDLAIAAEIELPDAASDLYIAGDRLVVTSHLTSQSNPSHRLVIADDWTILVGPATRIVVYDVTDRSAPALVRETRLDGKLVTSRLIGDHLYVVASEGLALPRPEKHCGPVEAGVDNPTLDVPLVTTDALSIWPRMPFVPLKRCVYESQEEYVARIGDHLSEDVLPRFELLDGSGELVDSGLIAAATEVIRPTVDDPDKLTSIVVLDVAAAAPGPVDAVIAIGDESSAVMVSPENIYLASQAQENGLTTTRIQQFAITADGADVEAVARGEVPGAPLNQFSLDEHDGYLRIATATTNPRRSSALYVLQRDGADLNIVGSLEGLAPGETMTGARFFGEQAILVTFQEIVRIDPLFTIDLSDPTHPQVGGELTIPGFSNYLHMVDEGMLIGLGRNGNSQPQLSLFDITDFSDPQRIDQVTPRVGQSGGSEALTNHHAVSYFADAGVLVVPFTSNVQRLNSFWVLSVEAGAEDPLRVLGSIRPGPGRPLRSLRIGDNLFTVSTEAVSVHPLRDPATVIDQAIIARIARDDNFSLELDRGATMLDVLANDQASESLRITLAADQTSLLGHVAVAEDGRSVIYTPPVGGVGRDSFTYTIEGPGWRDTATVQVQLTRTIEQERMVELARQDLAGRLATDPAEIELLGLWNVTWPNACLGVAAPDVACAQGVTPGFHILLRYQGQPFEYHTDKHESATLARTDHLMSLRAEVDVGSPWRNRTEPLDTTGDGVVSPRDALVIINYLDTDASHRLDAELSRATMDAAPNEPLLRLDVNSDGYISPIDVLIVVNALRDLEAEGEGAASVLAVNADSITTASDLVMWTPRQSAAEQPVAAFRPRVIAEVARGVALDIETAAVAVAEHATERLSTPREFDAFFAEWEAEGSGSGD